ncbi:MAG: hypothetical protein ACM3TR_04795, partial [Caulobacteraceae bacterium]
MNRLKFGKDRSVVGMDKWSLKKLMAFLLAVLILTNISFAGYPTLGMDVWAGTLSPENAITFTTDLTSVSKILLIDNEHYVIAQDSSGKMGIYRMNIAAKVLTRVCDVSTLIPGANSFIGYTKIGPDHRFVFSAETGETYNKNAKVSTLSSANLQSFTVSKLNSISISYPYSCGFSFSESDGYYYIDVVYSYARQSYEGYTGNAFKFYKSSDCLNWTAVISEIYSEGDISAYTYVSPAVEATNQRMVLTRGYYYYSDSSSGYYYRSYEHYLYRISGSSVTNDGYEQIYVQRDKRGAPYSLNSNGEYTISNYGRFSFLNRNRVYLPSSNNSQTSTDYRDIYLYYGVNSFYCGYAQRLSSTTALTYFDNGVYTNKLGTHGKYLYYVYTPSTPLPAGTYKVNVITGTNMNDTNILSITDYAGSTSFSTPTAIYLKITHTNGGITYHRLQNGTATVIMETEYSSAEATLPINPPVSEYQAQGYYECYVDSVKAIFFNSSANAFKIIYENS